MKILIERIKKFKLILLSGYCMFCFMKVSVFFLLIEIVFENINVDIFCLVIYYILKDIMILCCENYLLNVFFSFLKYMMF